MKSKIFLSSKQMRSLYDLGLITSDSRYVRLVNKGKTATSYILREKLEHGQEYDDAYSFEDILNKLPLLVHSVDKTDGKPLEYEMNFHGYRDNEFEPHYIFSYTAIRFSPSTALLPCSPYFVNLHRSGGLRGSTPLEAAYKTLVWFINHMPQELNL